MIKVKPNHRGSGSKGVLYIRGVRKDTMKFFAEEARRLGYRMPELFEVIAEEMKKNGKTAA
jgi:hypothetical protein